MSVPGGNTNPQRKQQRRLLMFSIPTALVAITLVIVLIACGPSAGSNEPAGATDSGSAPAASSASETSSSAGMSSSSGGSSSMAAGSSGGATAPKPAPVEAPSPSLSGDIAIDGSSTVFPITEAVAEEFGNLTGGNVRVTVGVSGTGGGFKKFCNSETVVSDASRPVKAKEVTMCGDAGIEFIELPVAIDGLTVMVNPGNDFVSCVTVDELHTVWAPEAEGVVTNWNQVRDSFPDMELDLYAPGTASGTFDYFTETVNDEAQASRADMTSSEDDNVLVQGIAGNKGSMGYFGYAYYAENTGKLKALGIDGGSGCVVPTDETINNGSYAPLSRPLFIYVRSDVAQEPHIKSFIEYYLSPEGRQLVSEVGYIPYPDEVYDLALVRFQQGITGTLFGGENPQKGPVADVLAGRTTAMMDKPAGEAMMMDYSSLKGDIAIDGSSTVFPITEAVAEEFGNLTGGNVRVTVGVSGTGGGFKKFCNSETVVSDASRPVKAKEVAMCGDAGIEFIELPVAIDGLTVMVNPDNDFVSCVTVDELHTVWAPEAEGVVTNWNQVRDSFPDMELDLYAPGTASGTFDYFTETVNDEAQASRADMTSSEDDNVLVQGIAGNKGSMGYFGYAYYAENTGKLKALGIDGGSGCVVPTDETINNGSYAPLSRPLFIYVRSDVAQEPHIKSFIEYYLSPEGRQLVSEVGYIPYPDEVYDLALVRFQQGITGTLFGGENPQKGPVADVLAGG